MIWKTLQLEFAIALTWSVLYVIKSAYEEKNGKTSYVNIIQLGWYVAIYKLKKFKSIWDIENILLAVLVFSMAAMILFQMYCNLV